MNIKKRPFPIIQKTNNHKNYILQNIFTDNQHLKCLIIRKNIFPYLNTLAYIS